MFRLSSKTMKIKLEAASLILGFLTFNMSPSKAGETNGPCIFPSTLNLKVGEHLYIEGHHLVPGERISEFTTLSRSAGIFYADTNGDLYWDITSYPGPTITTNYATGYIFSPWQSTNAYTNFTVSYAPSEIQPPYSLMGNPIRIDSSTYLYLPITVSVGNTYQLEKSTNPAGPWIKKGDTLTIWSSSWTNLVLGDSISPDAPQMFYRMRCVQ